MHPFFRSFLNLILNSSLSIDLAIRTSENFHAGDGAYFAAVHRGQCTGRAAFFYEDKSVLRHAMYYAYLWSEAIIDPQKK